MGKEFIWGERDIKTFQKYLPCLDLFIKEQIQSQDNLAKDNQKNTPETS